MVRAILAGTKTQTRRVVRNPDYGCLTGDCPHVLQANCDTDLRASCPYGVPGDRLWVRETFRQGDGSMSVHYAADPDEVSGGPWRPSIFMPRWACRIVLEVEAVRVERLQDISEADALAEGGVKREALPPDSDNFHPPGSYGFVSGLLPFPQGRIYPTAGAAFGERWDSINGKRAPWASNPWVWAITFRGVA